MTRINAEASGLRPHGGHAIDLILFIVRLLGLLGFLGGLAALSSMWAFGPTPKTGDEWKLLVGLVRGVFYPCVFLGIVLLVIAGTVLWFRHRRELHDRRWFRLMMILLAVAVPGSHLWARGTMLRLKDAVEQANLPEAAALWSRMGTAYVTSFAVMMLIAAIGIIKPRLGQR